MGEKWEVAAKVAAGFSGPVVARVIGKFILEMVVQWAVVSRWLVNLLI